jgi:hypothetical protein
VPAGVQPVVMGIATKAGISGSGGMPSGGPVVILDTNPQTPPVSILITSTQN